MRSGEGRGGRSLVNQNFQLNIQLKAGFLLLPRNSSSKLGGNVSWFLRGRSGGAGEYEFTPSGTQRSPFSKAH